MGFFFFRGLHFELSPGWSGDTKHLRVPCWLNHEQPGWSEPQPQLFSVLQLRLLRADRGQRCSLLFWHRGLRVRDGVCARPGLDEHALLHQGPEADGHLQHHDPEGQLKGAPIRGSRAHCFLCLFFLPDPF